jgi:phytoene dehydrogenase-like protein
MAALRLARRGWRVQVVEARTTPGGLASSFNVDGFTFDAGPYILLDRAGLEWAFQAAGLELVEHVALRRIDPVYEVVSGAEGAPWARCRFYADPQRTAAEFERTWPGSGQQYLRFVAATMATYQRLAPLLQVSHPGPVDLLRTGAWRAASFLLRSLEAVLAPTGLPQPVQDAISIWTHVAGQRTSQAPSPLAFVPALIHTSGAWIPLGGVGAIPRALAQVAAGAGVEFRYATRVRAIRCRQGQVCGVETEQGEFLPAQAVVSNAHGVGTYLELVDATPAWLRTRLRQLPLQSPGVCAYLAVRGRMEPPYLRFLLPGNGELCRLFVRPGVMDATLARDGWWPARLIAPMRYDQAEQMGPDGQHAFLERLLAETWWREEVTEMRVLATRTPAAWGAQFHLYANSINPVMTAHFMRAGRLAHRSPYVCGLYLAGSATHPGQWVSFCALSGILAADCLCEDEA